MIPFSWMLIAWIPISALLMMDKNNVRGFAIAMLGGLLLLPARNSVVIIGLPDLDKATVAPLGVFLGTLVFHPNLILKFRPRLADGILVVIALFMVATSVKNGFGLYDGLSNARNFGFTFLLPVFLARVHCSSLNGLGFMLVALAVASAGYSLPAVWEWRMSPQIHRTLYGYFPHTWLQFSRGGFFRPLVCFSHALPLGRFFAFTAFLAMFPLRGVLAKRVPYGEWLFLAPLAGLIVSMSYGPYAMFMAMCAFYIVGRKRMWVAYFIPALSAVWMVMVLAGMQPMYGAVETIRSFNPERAESLQYRLDALEEYSVPIRQQALLGWGGWGNARSDLATDSAFLIWSLSRGLVSSCMLFGWWVFAMYSCIRTASRYRGTPLADLLYGIALLIGVSFALSMVDNALDFHVMLLASSAMGLEVALRHGVPAQSGARGMAPAPAGG